MSQAANAPAKPRGRQFFANPGPTNIPDSILRAMDRASIDFNDADFNAVYQPAFAGLKRVLRTDQHVFMYAASGHGAWEATLTNLLSPGDAVLILESGYFSEEWGVMAEKLGLKPQTVHADWRRGVDIADVAAALRKDTAHAIKAVCVVHNETATGMTLPLAQIRRAIDDAGHPALFLADTISSLGSLEFRMDDWRIDGVVGGSQKGLMLPTGVSFSGVSDKGLAAHRTSRLARHYFDWSVMEKRPHKSFVGTIPTAFFYGLQEAVRLIEDEGLDNVVARHSRLAEATRRAVRVWSGNAGPQFFCLDPSRYSDSVTAILMPEGHSADALRATARNRFNVSLGGGLGPLNGKVFRIGHLGDLNEPMLLGALTAVEMSLKLNGVPHGAGGVTAAMDYLTETAAG
ncbi:MAG: aminotransferase class V-fold PLP-dependent enzyme [Proteobacteria bacterium]|nr:aminotransferase class V-fold PLP-dependent enzyme [Pseudomonadota bacterium]